MKLMKKILVSAMAISAVAAFNAVAFADEVVDPYVEIQNTGAAFTVKYDAATGTIKVPDVVVENTQQTLLVLNEDVPEFTETNAKAEAEDVENGVIVQIDQFSGEDAINGEAIVVGERKAGSTLVVRVGGDAAFVEAVCTIPGGGDTRFTNPDNLLGDVNDDGYFIMDDVAYAVGEYVNPGSLSGDALEAADATDDGYVIMDDVAVMVSAYVNLETSGLGTKKLSDKTVLVRDVRTAASSDAE